MVHPEITVQFEHPGEGLTLEDELEESLDEALADTMDEEPDTSLFKSYRKTHTADNDGHLRVRTTKTSRRDLN